MSLCSLSKNLYLCSFHRSAAEIYRCFSLPGKMKQNFLQPCLSPGLYKLLHLLMEQPSAPVYPQYLRLPSKVHLLKENRINRKKTFKLSKRNMQFSKLPGKEQIKNTLPLFILQYIEKFSWNILNLLVAELFQLLNRSNSLSYVGFCCFLSFFFFSFKQAIKSTKVL